MAVEKINIETFLSLSSSLPVFDVRSPGEYLHAHIPCAQSLPLFNDEERKIVGTAYKQQSREQAIKYGLDFFGVKMKNMVEAVEIFLKKTNKENKSQPNQTSANKIIVHCWRGGMRSAAVAWLLDLYGFEVSILTGGYKADRNWVLEQFEKEYPIKIIGGYTGSGKTEILLAIASMGTPVIDLEGLANHKGSAFGGIGQPHQPTQEMFENKLAEALFQMEREEAQKTFWIEDESQRIGKLNIPHALWQTIRKKPVYFLEIPFEERLLHIIDQYASLEKEKIIEAVSRIQKRLGPLETKTTLLFLMDNNFTEAFKILLTYYDKTYLKAMYNRENIEDLLTKISFTTVDAFSNSKKILYNHSSEEE